MENTNHKLIKIEEQDGKGASWRIVNLTNYSYDPDEKEHCELKCKYRYMNPNSKDKNECDSNSKDENECDSIFYYDSCKEMKKKIKEISGKKENSELENFISVRKQYTTEKNNQFDPSKRQKIVVTRKVEKNGAMFAQDFYELDSFDKYYGDLIKK